MKNPPAKLLTALLFLLASPACAPAKTWDIAPLQVQFDQTENPMLVVLGDSNVVSWHRGNPEVPGFILIAWAKGGINSRDSLAGLKNIVWTKRPAECRGMLGTNDAAGHKNGPELTPKQTKANIEAIMEIMKANCGHLVWFSILPNEAGLDMEKYQKAVHAAAIAQAVEYVDLRPAFNKGYTIPDGVHLNGAGAAKFTEILNATLRD